jgi:hypothetical protein
METVFFPFHRIREGSQMCNLERGAFVIICTVTFILQASTKVISRISTDEYPGWLRGIGSRVIRERESTCVYPFWATTPKNAQCNEWTVSYQHNAL